MNIQDLLPEVRDKLRGRKDLDARIPLWIQQTVSDLTQSYPFEELAISAPATKFVARQSTYAIKYFGLANDGSRFSRVLSFFRYFDTVGIPGTSTGSIIKARVITTVEPLANVLGLPVMWAQVGQQLIFGCMPDQAYAVYMRYQRVHPFDHNNLTNAQIFMPSDWREIVAYGAAIRGCDFLGMNEQSQLYYNKLHGDPKEPGNLGLLAVRQSQQRRNITGNERQLQPVVSKY